jgi:hypothetical protein
MIQAVRRVVHDGASPEEAYEFFRELAHQGAPAGA